MFVFFCWRSLSGSCVILFWLQQPIASFPCAAFKDCTTICFQSPWPFWGHVTACCHGHLAEAAKYFLPQTISPKNNDITHIYCYLRLCFCHSQSCSRCFRWNCAIFDRLLGWQCCCTLHTCVYPSITFGALVPILSP